MIPLGYESSLGYLRSRDLNIGRRRVELRVEARLLQTDRVTVRHIHWNFALDPANVRLSFAAQLLVLMLNQ